MNKPHKPTPPAQRPLGHKPIRNEARQRRVALIVAISMVAVIAIPAVMLLLSVL